MMVSNKTETKSNNKTNETLKEETKMKKVITTFILAGIMSIYTVIISPAVYALNFVTYRPSTSQSWQINPGPYVYAPRPGDSCGQNLIIDCSGKCVYASTAKNYMGDEVCNDGYNGGYDLECSAFSLDGGDCLFNVAGESCSQAFDLNTVVIPRKAIRLDSVLKYSGDADWFMIHLPYAAQIVIGTEGNTDTFGALFSSCNQSSPNGWNDDGPNGKNFNINTQTFPGGTVYIRVTHATGGTGYYTLVVYVNPLS